MQAVGAGNRRNAGASDTRNGGSRRAARGARPAGGGETAAGSSGNSLPGGKKTARSTVKVTDAPGKRAVRVSPDVGKPYSARRRPR